MGSIGEIDTTRRMLSQIAAATTEAVVLNREDPRIASLAHDVRPGTAVHWYGLSEKLRPMFPSDDDMRGADGPEAPVPSQEAKPEAIVQLEDFEATDVTFSVRGEPAQAEVHLYGVYNVYNAAAALALALTVSQDRSGPSAALPSLLGELSRVTPTDPLVSFSSHFVFSRFRCTVAIVLLVVSLLQVFRPSARACAHALLYFYT